MPSMMRPFFLLSLLSLAELSWAASSNTTCTATFTPVTAADAFASLNPGWNLGNTLDATPDEGDWGNAPVVPATLSEIQAKGFKSVRIPITWAYHFVDDVSPWTVNSTWMDRVETVVDEALALGLYVVINVHHDSWIWADVTASDANYTLIEDKFSSLWSQIGTRFACKSSKLLFEPLNEPTGTTEAHADELNVLNGLFLDAINNAGGYNPQRVVSLSGLGMNTAYTSEWFVRGTAYPDQPWGLQFHYYSPYEFIFDAWGATIWGSDADKAALLEDFSLFNGNFTDIPAFIGEYDASPANTEAAARWKYFDYFIQTANSFNYSSIVWDNGGDLFNRTANTWYDPITISVLLNAVAGTANTLADSTTDASLSSQNTSAYLFHHVGDPVIAQSVSYLLNGNTLSSIADAAGNVLSTTDYSIDTTGTLTFASTYLSTLYTASTAPGTLATLTLTFSAGSPLTLTIVQYDTPSLPTSSYTVDPSADLYVPINWAGLEKVAAVKAVLADGSFMVDSWTQYLGPLQQGRWTYGSWGWNSQGLVVYESGLTVIKEAGQTVVLTLEFFPRTEGQNSVNLTFTQ